jgi:hypothetical protein
MLSCLLVEKLFGPQEIPTRCPRVRRARGRGSSRKGCAATRLCSTRTIELVGNLVVQPSRTLERVAYRGGNSSGHAIGLSSAKRA